jgi:hypothetical protein
VSFPALTDLCNAQDEDLVNDGWTDIIRKLLVMMREDQGGAVSRDGIAKTLELADFQKMEQIRARVDSIVRDKDTLAGCGRCADHPDRADRNSRRGTFGPPCSSVWPDRR